MAFLQEVNLHPGSAIEANFQHHWLANQGVNRLGRYISHTCGTREGISICGSRTEEAVVASSRLNSALAIYLPSTIAVRTVEQVNLFSLTIVVETRFVAGKLDQRWRYSMLRICVQTMFLEFIMVAMWLKTGADLPRSLCP